LCCSITARMRAKLSAATSCGWLIARETVAGETRALRAISVISFGRG
jgi:hypothetical protein